MRKNWCFLILGPLLVAANAARLELRETLGPTPGQSPAQFTAFLDAAVPGWMARDHVPGLCIGTVSGKDRPVRCYGIANASTGRPVDGTSRFAIASVSKTFTALAVLALASDGTFGLDDRVEAHLRSWQFPPGQFDGAAVTIRQLLTHTAGVGVPSYGGASTPPSGDTTRDVLEGRGIGREPVRLIASPGSAFRYSGGGYVVLQQLVEDASGTPFEEFVSTRIFRPLGMADSSFSWGLTRDGDTVGHDVAGRPLARRSYGAAMAPGGMVTTANDMMQFLEAMAESTLPVRLGWRDGTWAQFVDSDHLGYGMALVVGRASDRLLVGHSGTTMGYNAGFTALPLEQGGWFVLENGNGGPYLKAEIDRAFVGWKTGTIEPRYRLMQLLRVVVAFLGALLACMGFLLLAVFAWSHRTRGWTLISSRRPSLLGSVLRVLTIAALIAFVAAWFVFFHTDAFYPAYTTAWLPYPFRFVTLGVALLALRVALACAYVPRQSALTA